MPFARQIRHILFGGLACLMIVCLSAGYWAIAGRDGLLLREDNPRRIEALAAIQRGSIADRQGRVLAQTVSSDSGLARRYPLPAAYSLVGYSSLRYGVGGVEAAYDELLAGARPLESLADYFNRHALRMPQVGADILLTIDADIHEALVQGMATDSSAMGGAAIVLDARAGSLLALVSLPSFDPNRLDEDWSQLIEAEGKPFFNRALQGNYQLGGNIYALWLAQALAGDFDLSLRFTDGAEALVLDDGTEIGCLIQPAASEISLPVALSYSCPTPFASLHQAEAESEYADLLAAFRIADPVILPGFPQPEPIPSSNRTTDLEPNALTLRNILGQGEVTSSPMRLALIMAAIANDGIATSPWILAGIRQPNAGDWQAATPDSASFRLFDAAVALELQARLQDAWLTLAGDSHPQHGDFGAFLAMSRSGDETQLWLNGYVSQAERKTAFVILLEDSADIERILGIGKSLVEALGQAP